MLNLMNLWFSRMTRFDTQKAYEHRGGRTCRTCVTFFMIRRKNTEWKKKIPPVCRYFLRKWAKRSARFDRFVPAALGAAFGLLNLHGRCAQGSTYGIKGHANAKMV